MKKGDRAQMTAAAIAVRMHGGKAHTVFGTVIGWSHGLIRVKRDGIATVQNYAPHFWAVL